MDSDGGTVIPSKRKTASDTAQDSAVNKKHGDRRRMSTRGQTTTGICINVSYYCPCCYSNSHCRHLLLLRGFTVCYNNLSICSYALEY